MQVRVEYKDTPPQVFIAELNSFIRSRQPPSGFRTEISWERVISPEERDLEEQHQSRQQ